MMRDALKRLRHRRAAVSVLFLVSFAIALSACGPGEDPDQDQEPDSPVDPGAPPDQSGTKWLTHTVKIPEKMRGFVISTPKGWGPLRIPNDWGLQFAPKGDGWRRNFSVYWAKRDESLERLFSDGKAKYLQGPFGGEEIEEGEGAVAGMPARFLIFERYEKPVGARLAWMVWFYVGPDGFGEVKAECRASDFKKYRPLFEEMTRRIRYRSP